MIYSNVDINRQKADLEHFEALTSHRFDTSMAREERKATLAGALGVTDQSPEVIEAGEDPTQFSFENRMGQSDIDAQRIREARQYGYLKPDVFIKHETHLERTFANTHALHALNAGLFCVRCHQAQPDTMEEAKRLHREKVGSLPGNYTIPDGLTPMDACCYCGAILAKGQVAA